ncbi:MAG: PAS domain S-box protein, partial [Bacteroidales bacterium]
MKNSTAKDNQSEISKKTKSVLQEELVASELRYRRLFESTKDGILILDAETGKIVDVNPFLIDLLNYSKNEFIEKFIWEIGAFQDIIENKDKFLELQQMEYVRYEDLPLETSDGSKILVEFVSNVYLVNNDKVIQCQIRDITARKETEAILEKTRKELAEIKKSADELNKFTENVIDSVREPLLAIDKDLRVIKASRSFYNFFMVTAEETIGKLIYELGNHQWDIPKLKELLEKIIPEKNSFDNYEVEHSFSTIGRRVMHLNARQVKRAFGKEKIILLAIEDITERKGKEDTLKAKHRATSDFLNILLNHMHAPIIVWDTSMIIKRFNRKFEELSGYDSAEVINKKIDFLFPKDKIDTTLELLKNHLTDEQETVEIPILTKENSVKTVLWSSSRILDEEGKNIIATISQDITNRKRLEDTLNLLETRYRRLFESAKDGIIILDAETGKIVDVNPFLIDLLGYTKNELIEKSIWEIGVLQDIYENKEKFLELQQKEYVRYDDLPLVTSDGREIHVGFVSNVYLANNKKVIQCNIRDNTENWQIKKQIIESEEKFRGLAENTSDVIL